MPKVTGANARTRSQTQKISTANLPFNICQRRSRDTLLASWAQSSASHTVMHFRGALHMGYKVAQGPLPPDGATQQFCIYTNNRMPLGPRSSGIHFQFLYFHYSKRRTFNYLSSNKNSHLTSDFLLIWVESKTTSLFRLIHLSESFLWDDY